MMLQKELKALGKKNLLITEKQTASLFQMAPTASIVKWSQVEDAQVDEPDTKVGLAGQGTMGYSMAGPRDTMLLQPRLLCVASSEPILSHAGL